MMNLDGYIPWFSDVKAKLLDRASDIQFGDLDQTLRRICAVLEGYFLYMLSNHEKSIDLRKKTCVHLYALVWWIQKQHFILCLFVAAWFAVNVEHWFRIGTCKNRRLPATTVCYHVPFWLREWCEEQGAELLQEVLDELHSCKKTVRP